ncbi:MAG: DNA-binding protein [Hyphomicrobiales bacterium]|nr:MAG: DNA-binding protein [Hyphomicrobiales bacterium]
MLSRPLLTLHEVSELLKVKEATVRTWINQGALRAIKFGREWRVAFKDLEYFVEMRATSAGQNEPAVSDKAARDAAKKKTGA